MSCEIKLKFKDSDEEVTLRDKDLIGRIPLLKRAIASQDDQWEERDEVIVATPLDIPFPKYAGEFLFNHLRTYVAPNDRREETKVDHYKEAKEKNLTELKQILELANFMECVEFMHCIGFSISRKLDSKNVNEIAEFLGIQMEPEESLANLEDGWVYPPSDIFRSD